MAAKFFMNGGVDSNWSSDTNWSTTASTGPNNTTHAVAGDTVTINAGSPACVIDTASACTSVVCTGYTNTLTFNANITVSGTVTFASGMTIAGTAGDLIVDTNATLTSGGKTLTGGMRFQGATRTFTLSGAWVVNGLVQIIGTGTATFTSSTMSSGGGMTVSQTVGGGSTTTFTLTGGTWSGASVFNPSLALAGNVTISGSVNYGSGTLSYTSGTITTTGSTITMAAANTLNVAAVTFNNITFSGNVTYTLAAGLTLSGTLAISASATFSGAFNISAGTMTITGTPTITLSGNLTVTGTLTLPNGTMTWAGAFTITCGTLTNTSYTLTRVVTWAAGSTIIINTAFTTVGGSATIRFTWKTSSAGVTAAWLLGFGATQSVAYVDPTDLNATGGQVVFTYAGVISNSLNWTSSLPPLATEISSIYMS